MPPVMGAAAFLMVEYVGIPYTDVVKHANPCGVALGEDILAAYERAFSTDPTSAFGGIRITSYNVCYTKLLRARGPRTG